MCLCFDFNKVSYTHFPCIRRVRTSPSAKLRMALTPLVCFSIFIRVAFSMGQAPSLHNTGLSIPYSHSYHNVNIPTADLQHAKRVFAPRSALQPRQPEYRTEVDWTTLRLYGEEDRLPDFSYAGAWASSRELPSPRRSASITLDPTGDNTDRTYVQSNQCSPALDSIALQKRDSSSYQQTSTRRRRRPRS